MAKTPAEEAARLRAEMGKGLCICILGGTKFNEASSEELVKALARELEKASDASEAFFVTGGMGGVQEVFAKHCGDGSRVWNLLADSQTGDYGVGKDVHAGANLEDRKEIFGQLGDVYITIEGGPGVAQEARAAHERGATILPLMRTGGASGGMFDFPKAALERPDFASEEQWASLKKKEASADESAQAVVALVKHHTKKHNAGIWDILDELIGFKLETLLKALAVIACILFVCSSCFIYREISRGEPMMALLHGGFLFLVVGLGASIAWVVNESSRVDAAKSDQDSAGEPAAEDKKAK